MTLGEYLQLKGMSAVDFARLIRVSKVSVYRYLSGRLPRQEVMKRILRVTEGRVTADSFFSQQKAA